MNDIDDTRKSRIWDEIIKEAQELNLPPQDGEMTAKMFAELTGKSVNIAKKFLDQKVADGELTERFSIIDRHKTTIYSPSPPK